MPSPPKFKTAHWAGIVRPNLGHESELNTLTIRLPKELAEDVVLAAQEYRCLFDSVEEVITTAVSWALRSLADEPPTSKPKPSGVRRRERRTRQ